MSNAKKENLKIIKEKIISAIEPEVLKKSDDLSHNLYILDENKNVIPADFIEWGIFFTYYSKRRVKQETINGFKISTIFIGYNHEIFKTMVFKGKGIDIYCDRYSTWKEAEEGHKKAIEWVKNGCIEEDTIYR